jgi:hypothetical protein
MQESSPFVCFIKSADMNLYIQTLDLISGEITIILVQRKEQEIKRKMKQKRDNTLRYRRT